MAMRDFYIVGSNVSFPLSPPGPMNGSCQGQQFLIQYSDVTTETHRIIYDVTQKGSTCIVTSYSMIFHAQIGVKLIWARSQRCGCLVTLFCYQLIAKPVNKIAALSRDLTHIPQ